MTKNPFSQPMRELMNDPQFDWARSRTRRRQLVGAFAGVAIAMPILCWVLGSVWIIAAMLLPLVLVMGSLNASVRGLTELRARDLDERETRTREPVYTKLYWPGVFVATVAGFFIGNIGSADQLLVPALGLSFFNVAIGLPTLWLAWTLPDEPTD